MERLIEEYRRRWLEAFDKEWNQVNVLPKGYEMKITPQPWISVSEDLPERDREVLVTNGTRYGVAWFVDGYIDAVPLQEWDGTPIVPTHWMPLPEPPKCATH